MKQKFAQGKLRRIGTMITNEEMKWLKKLRAYMVSGEWKKKGNFDMYDDWSMGIPAKYNYDEEIRPCGCLGGHAQQAGIIDNMYTVFSTNTRAGWSLWEFLFSSEWARAFHENPPKEDEQVAEAIGRLDCVIEGIVE